MKRAAKVPSTRPGQHCFLAAAIVFGSVSAVSAVHAQSLKVNEFGFDPKDPKPLRIEAVITDGPVTIARAISLTAAKRGDATVNLFKLDPVEDSPTIKDAQITLPAIVAFGENGGTQELDFRISNVGLPGRYEGRIELTFGTEIPIKVPFEIDVFMRPIVSITPKPVTVNLVDCTWTCFIADWLVPGGSRRSISLLATNQSPGQVAVLESNTLLLSSNDTGQSMRAATQAATLGLNEQEPLRVDFSGNDLAPGTYAGDLRIRSENAGEPRLLLVSQDGEAVELDVENQIVPATVNVRDEPLFPLLLIVLGVVAGRFALRLGDAKTKEQMELYPRYQSLAQAAEQLADERAKRFLGFKLTEIYGDIDTATKAKADIVAAMDATDALIRAFGRLERINDIVLSEVADPAKQQELLSRAQAAANDLVNNRPDDAAEKIERLIADLSTAPPSNRAAALAVQGDGLRSAVESLAQAAAAERERAETQKARESAEGFGAAVASAYRATMDGITGESAYTPVGTKYAVWRPLAFAVLVIALVMQGLVLNYGGDANATFGAGGVADYAKLLLWGVGTEVANRTLQQIRF